MNIFGHPSFLNQWILGCYYFYNRFFWTSDKKMFQCGQKVMKVSIESK